MVALGRVVALVLLAPCAAFLQPARPAGLARGPRLSPRARGQVSSESQFDEAIAGADGALVIVDYSTTWCGPCKVMEPKFVELSDQYDSAIFLKVIGDSCPEASSLMKRGRPVRPGVPLLEGRQEDRRRQRREHRGAHAVAQEARLVGVNERAPRRALGAAAAARREASPRPPRGPRAPYPTGALRAPGRPGR